MSDLIDDPRIGANEPEFSVSEISNAIKRVIEGEFSYVRIRGEIGRVSLPRSGHVYLDLKDDKSVISAVIWKGVASRLQTRPEEGLEVVATGRVTTFGGQSKYQLVIDDIKPAGVGALMAMLEKRKAMLAGEGLFDASRKKSIPYLPDVIGVVTSPSGAVIRDILHRLRDRFPRHVLIWPVAVQGEKSAAQVANAITGFNRLAPNGDIPRPDLLIVARGGGSLEDLWSFNEEVVARAAAASEIPLISAVGHETDTTLIDFVSDKRAPTPTAAAEMAVPVRYELLAWIGEQGARLGNQMSENIGRRTQRMNDISRALPKIESLLETPRQRLDYASDQLPKALKGGLREKRILLNERVGVLHPRALVQLLQSATQQVQTLSNRFGPSLDRLLMRRHDQLSTHSARLRPANLRRDLDRAKSDYFRLCERFKNTAKAQINAHQERLAHLQRLRETLGYKETLNRGYAVVRGGDTVITCAADAKRAASFEIEFRDGVVPVLTSDGETKSKSSRVKHQTPKNAKKTPEQGSLF